MELDPTEFIAVGAIGEPGQRTFYLQARGGRGARALTLVVEKFQVQALAERTVELLQGRDSGPEETPAELEEPVLPDWRAGQLGIGLDPDRDRMVLVAQEMPEDEDTPESALSSARLWLRPAQMLAVAARSLELAQTGRPLCPVCGLPMNPEGHLCPRKNGKSPAFN